MAVALPAPPAPPQQPSATALGKRPQRDPPAHPNKKRANPVQQAQKQERRVTRSSLGGPGAANKDAGDQDGDGNGPLLYLPLKTPILLTTRTIPNLRRHPPPSAALPTSTTSTSAEAGPSAVQTGLPGSEVVANEAPRQQKEPEAPLFRLMNESELLPPRGARHAAPPEVDTSDAFYLRLHRYPEVLEKRASRLERERLIHERSKLINELEELKGRTWVYAGTSAGGRAEEERQRKIKAMEERLARYDILLPNQPRKSNFLNLREAASSAPTPSIPSHASHTRLSPSRSTASPAPSASLPAPRPRPRTGGPATRAHPVLPLASTSSSSAAAAGQADLITRPSTPLSATAAGASGGTTIRIRFGPPSAASSPAPPPAGSLPHPPAKRPAAPRKVEKDHDLDDDRYTLTGELRKGPKRDRRAERERAEQRKRLGLAPRASIDKHIAGGKVGKRPAAPRASVGGGTGGVVVKTAAATRERRGSKIRSYAETDDEEEEEYDELDDGEEGEEEDGEEEDDEEDEEEEGDERQEGDDEWDDPETVLPTTRPRRSSTSRPPPRLRLRDSFFQSAALRDSIMAPHWASHAAYVARRVSGVLHEQQQQQQQAASAPAEQPRSRRSSARVAYAFGQRLPDVALLRQSEFEPHGGVADDSSEDERTEGNSKVRIEDLVRGRRESKGEQVVVLGGRVLPKSALDVWAQGPIVFSPVKAGTASGGNSVAASVSEVGSRAPSPLPVNANGFHLPQQQAHVFASAPSPSPAPPPYPPPQPPPASSLPPSSLSMVGYPAPPPPSAPAAVPPMSLSMPGAFAMDVDG
ncbi:hypothetical protein JCM8547_000372 [Rhodosporidiobolus lusitaniae]